MNAESFKSEAHRLIDGLPESARWKELGYECYVREQIERGLEDAQAGRKKTLDEVFAQFGISDAN